MKLKILTSVVVIFMACFAFAPYVAADDELNTTPPPATTQDYDKYCGSTLLKDGQSCSADGVATSIIKCDGSGSGNIEDSCVWSLLITGINILTAGIGLLAVGGIIYGSILYTTAGGSMDQTKQAIKLIQNVIIGLVAYALMYAFLNYIIPGGVFK